MTRRAARHRSTPLGSGGPGYQIPAEITTDLLHYKGALAAARQGDAVNPERKSSGSQFYLVHGRTFSKVELLNIEARNFGPGVDAGEPLSIRTQPLNAT